MNDDAVMKKVNAGKPEYLSILFERHHLKIYNYFLRLSGDRNQSEDLTQEVFFRVLKYSKSFRGESMFLTWLYSIARNLFYDSCRKEKNRGLVDSEIPEHVESNTVAPEIDMERQEALNRLYEAIDQLPADKKEVLILSKFQGMKYEEISVLLNCTVSTVKIRVFRAMKALKSRYRM